MNHARTLMTTTVVLALSALAATGCGRNPAPGGETATTTLTETSADTTLGSCIRHDLPVAACFICDPSLRDPDRLWCGEHDRYEDRCFLCHPEIEDPERLWCGEHSLYEDECFLCHPELRESVTTAAPEIAGLHCLEHDVSESECGICHPDLAADLEPGSGLKIRFESAKSASLAGVETATPVVEARRSDATFLARVTWDENHYARVTPLAAGVLRGVTADVGLTVSRGDRLATLSSPEIAEIKSTYLAARADEKLHLAILTRQQGLVEQRISAQQNLDQAEAEYEVAKSRTSAARQLLIDHGVGEEAIRHLEETGSTSSDLDVVAPLDGTIVDRHAVVGESVEPGQALFRVARLDSMWLELSIPERDVARVAAGQALTATFDLQPGLEAHGRITWVGSSIDPETRMVTARAEVANPGRQLRHGMFGRARIGASETSETLWVPGDAVQYIDEQPFVFARLADDLFELRKIALGGSSGRMVAIASGLDPEEEIVVAHSFALKSELLKSRLGAGCVDH